MTDDEPQDVDANQAKSIPPRHRVQMLSSRLTLAEADRRERIAASIMAGVAHETRWMVTQGQMVIQPAPTESAFVAVALADALMAQLDAPPSEAA